jgi:hypothetical protein
MNQIELPGKIRRCIRHIIPQPGFDRSHHGCRISLMLSFFIKKAEQAPEEAAG